MKHRDALITELNSTTIVITTDNSVSIGNKINDIVKVEPKLVGALTARVALLEAVSLGAIPHAISCTLSFPLNSDDAEQIMTGIKQEVKNYGVSEQNITGSCETNFPATITAIGITVVSSFNREPLINKLQNKDKVFIIGMPRVGTEVVTNLSKLPKYNTLDKLLNTVGVHEIIPCGSGGIGAELNRFKQETGFIVDVDQPPIDFNKSAGPASCLIVIGDTTKEHLKSILNCEITYIGYLRR